MKQVTILIITLSFIYSCQNKTEMYTRESNDMTLLTNNKNSLIYYFDSYDSLKKIRDTVNRLEYFFYEGDINKIKKIILVDSAFYKSLEIDFDNLNKISKIQFYDEINNEWIEQTINDEDKIFKIYKYLPLPIDRPVLTSYLTVHNKDTINYFFYTKNRAGFKIHTDEIIFKEFNLAIMDSMIIEFTKANKNVSFVSPEKHVYIPTLSTSNTQKIKNNVYISTNQNQIIGTFWVFLKNEKQFGYKLIYFNGDIIKRINNKNVEFQLLLSYQSETINNEILFQQIIESNLYKLKDNTLIKKEVTGIKNR